MVEDIIMLLGIPAIFAFAASLCFLTGYLLVKTAMYILVYPYVRAAEKKLLK